MSDTPAQDALPDFEKSLAELEEIVTRLENGELSLADALKAYERGVRLTRTCQKAIEEAELSLKQLEASPSTGGIAE
jgi:exodeoxyribonuclease VII small subunit